MTFFSDLLSRTPRPAADNPEEIPTMAAPIKMGMGGRVNPHDTLTVPLGAPPEPVTQPGMSGKPSALDEQEGRMRSKLNDLEPKPYTGNHPTLHKLLHGLETAGNVAGDIFAPGTMSLIPGTQLNKQVQRAGLGKGIEGIEAEKSKEGLDQAQAGEAVSRGKEAEAKAKEDEAAAQPKAATWKAVPGVIGPDGQVLQESTDGQLRWAPEITGAGPLKEPTTHLEHVTVSGPDGKPMSANYDPAKGTYTDTAGRPLTNVRPYEKPQNVGVTVMVPNGQGGYTVQRATPGQEVAPGAVTAQGMNTINTPTSQMRNVAAQASLVHEQTPEVLAEIDRNAAQMGPLAGRWNEFMQGHVGAPNPEMAALRADLLMYSSAVALMHARGRLPENLREEFDHAINAPQQSPENLKAAIHKIDDWTAKNMHAMGAGGNQSNTVNEPTRQTAVPKDYVFDAHGPKGAGWYRPNAAKAQ